MAIIHPAAAGVPSGIFSEEELSFARMIDKGGILIGDRWFSARSTELERAKYLVSYCRRIERNRRRRDRRRQRNSAPKQRNVRGFVGIDTESQRANRLLLERRKCLRRTTFARCPTPSEIRTAFRFRNDRPDTKLRLGGMLLDLECYVDNSLKVSGQGDNALIVGRRGGILGWIRENCPELVAKYKTLMRFRAMAKNLRQDLAVSDPIPTSVILDPAIPLSRLVGAPLQIQPRGDRDDETETVVRTRFAWEGSRIHVDANGRGFRENENYWLINHAPGCVIAAAGHLGRAQARASEIILNGTGNRTIENYVRGLGAIPSRTPLKHDGEAAMRTIRAERSRRQRGLLGVLEDGLGAWVDMPYQITHPRYFTRKDLEDEW